MNVPDTSPDHAATEARWQRRLERERAARKQAEQLLEQKSRELYHSNRALTQLTQELERQVEERTAQLQTALRKAEEATRAKSDFLAVMSHEIRTPMNSILGTVQLLELSHLDETQRDYLKTIQHSGDGLLLLINDILDMSKIEAGMLELERRPFRLRDELASIATLYRSLAHEKGLDLELTLAPGLPEGVCGDHTRLRQIITNLLANALKFTHRGWVTLEVGASTREDGRIRLEVAVSDTGIGIPADRLDRLFQNFSQVDVSTTRQYGGTGLGLAICQRLCAAMDGEIGVESGRQQGARFWFHVVLDPAEPPAREAAPVSPPPGEAFLPTQVLVVDDNRVNRSLAVAMLSKLGVSATQAASGREAVDMAAARLFDLILMDVQMPGMDGLEATRQIRDLDLPEQPYIVALTANAFDADRERCLQAGMDDFLSKPYRLADLRTKLAAFRRPAS